MNATTRPKNFEEWLQSAPVEELVQGLYERLEEAQTKNSELEVKIISLKENRNTLYSFLIGHKHDDAGKVMLPAEFMKFAD